MSNVQPGREMTDVLTLRCDVNVNSERATCINQNVLLEATQPLPGNRFFLLCVCVGGWWWSYGCVCVCTCVYVCVCLREFVCVRIPAIVVGSFDLNSKIACDYCVYVRDHSNFFSISLVPTHCFLYIKGIYCLFNMEQMPRIHHFQLYLVNTPKKFYGDVAF